MLCALPSCDQYFSCMALHQPYIGLMESATLQPNFRQIALTAPSISHARFSIGEVVRHRLFGFRGVVFDIDPVFANSEDWYNAIPEDMRPDRQQPFYHLLAENAEGSYIAYVSQQNLIADDSGEPVDHPAIANLFGALKSGKYMLHPLYRH
jgi:heat shock protein HspQ